MPGSVEDINLIILSLRTPLAGGLPLTLCFRITSRERIYDFLVLDMWSNSWVVRGV
jgi:hypothetical protein